MNLRTLLIFAMTATAPLAVANPALDYKKKIEESRKKQKKRFPVKHKVKKQPRATPRPQPKPSVLKPTPKAQAPAVQPNPVVPNVRVDPSATVRQAWQKFPDSKNACTSGLYVDSLTSGFFDFSGRITACFAASLVDLATIQKITGKPLFVDGPHTPILFNLRSTKSFGHYNKAVVQWALDNGVPAASDSAFKAMTAPVYQNYLKKNVENFLATIYGLEANPVIYERLQKIYSEAVQSKSGLMSPEGLLYRERKGLPSKASGPLIVAFWVRRKIDGTAPLMKQVLEKVVMTYDPGAMSAIKKIATSAPL